jgi:hypothetical protein
MIFSVAILAIALADGYAHASHGDELTICPASRP